MKATNTIKNITKSLIIIISVFFIQFSSVYAGSDNTNPPSAPTFIALIQTLAPVNPETCDFNDAELNAADFSYLAPLIPSEADFNDIPETDLNIAHLAPVTPAETEFSDADLENTDITSLAPVTPDQTDFND